MTVSRPRGHAVCLLAATLFAAPLRAEEPATIEEVVVTGSRIPRPDFTSASPIVTVDAEAFEHTLSTSVEGVLSRLPQFVPEYGASSNNPGQGGMATLQLRGLGAFSTLVLLDGRRLVPATGAGAVDVNIIPPALLERVEIISGGASAVYGSDAVAGVVNFRLKQDFDGVQVDGSWGQTSQDDGEERAVGITAGTAFAEQRGHVYGYLGYTERDGVTQAARGFSGYSLRYLGPGAGGVGPDGGFVPGGSGTVAETTVRGLDYDPAAFDALFEGYGYPAGTVRPSDLATNADGSLFTVGCRRCAPGSVVNFKGERDPALFNDRWYTYNFAPWNYLQLPLERTSAFGKGSFELASGAEVYAQVLYADYSADRALAPTPVISALYMPRSNPYIPADLAQLFDPQAPADADLVLDKRFVELGPRLVSNDYQVFQGTVGVRGDLAHDWHYEAYAQHGDNDQREEQQGNVSRTRIFDLTYAPDGGQSVCGEFNLFRVGGISPECAAYISVAGTNRSGYKQTIYELSLNGPVWTLPAGDVALALGVMRKSDQYFYRADPIASVFLTDLDGQSDVWGFNATDDIAGSDHNTDFYAEARVPLLAERSWARELEMLLGYRHSQYDSAGGADAWKAEFMYRPVDALLLRGSAQRAVRAPSIYELYLPRLPVTYSPFDIYDPCAYDSDERNGPDAARVESLCLAQGVPAALLADFTPETDMVGVNGGNTGLEPEAASTQTLGVVWSPGFEQPLYAQIQLGVDWFRIEIDDAISLVEAPTYVPACFDPATNPGMTADGHWCGFFGRNASTGQIQNLTDTLVNFGRVDSSGVDLHLDWQFPLGPGEVALGALASWLDSFEVMPEYGLPREDYTGKVGGMIGGSQPVWKGNLDLGYRWQGLTAGLKWRFIDAMEDVDTNGVLAANGWRYRVPSQHYWDLYADAAFESGMLAGISLRAGVENLTDEVPPLLPSAVAANTDPSLYDVMGRRYYLNASYRF